MDVCDVSHSPMLELLHKEKLSVSVDPEIQTNKGYFEILFGY
jgi:hypothetical protein